jgi:hypothetical protein
MRIWQNWQSVLIIKFCLGPVHLTLIYPEECVIKTKSQYNKQLWIPCCIPCKVSDSVKSLNALVS